MKIDIREISYGSPEYLEEVGLRKKILRDPLGLTFSDADLAIDSRDIHLAAFNGDELVGCLILTSMSPRQVRMRQVAVDSQVQRQGVGRSLVEESEEISRRLGFTEIVLNAREYAIPFYLSLGYEIFGEPFVEVSLPHRRMRKRLA